MSGVEIKTFTPSRPTPMREAATAHMPALVNDYSLVLSHGSGAELWDVNGNRYLDLLAGYGAVNQGHAHPRLVQALTDQAAKLTMIPRVYHHEPADTFYTELAQVTGYEQAVIMNSGAEAVETAFKLARRWGYQRKGIPEDEAEIIAFSGNFHGRTMAGISLSGSPKVRDGFGPYLNGIRRVPFGDIGAVRAAIHTKTCAVILEPIQGQGGVVIPPLEFLRELQQECDASRVLLIVDEIQSGLGRTGTWFAYQHAGIRPDAVILGKSLSGGILPVSALVADAALMSVWTPGSHGSTFGGNPLACAVGYAALRVLIEEALIERAQFLGDLLGDLLKQLPSNRVVETRHIGLWAGVQLVPELSARAVCERLIGHGILADATGNNTIRLSPPLVISRDQLAWAIEKLKRCLLSD